MEAHAGAQRDVPHALVRAGGSPGGGEFGLEPHFAIHPDKRVVGNARGQIDGEIRVAGGLRRGDEAVGRALRDDNGAAAPRRCGLRGSRQGGEGEAREAASGDVHGKFLLRPSARLHPSGWTNAAGDFSGSGPCCA